MRYVLVTLFAAVAPLCHAIPLAPVWLSALDAIRMLPDPFDPHAIARIPGAPRFTPPHCVYAEQPRPRIWRCWSEVETRGPVSRATLDYAKARRGGPSTDGSLSLVLAHDPCTTVAELEAQFDKPLLRRRVFPESFGAAPAEAPDAYGIRLFGASMRMLDLNVDVARGCIVHVSLRPAH